jgi:hypothetical protein
MLGSQTKSKWKEKALDLNPYQGKNILVRFFAESSKILKDGVSTSDLWYLQNIRIDPEYQPTP